MIERADYLIVDYEFSKKHAAIAYITYNHHRMPNAWYERIAEKLPDTEKEFITKEIMEVEDWPTARRMISLFSELPVRAVNEYPDINFKNISLSIEHTIDEVLRPNFGMEIAFEGML